MRIPVAQPDTTARLPCRRFGAVECSVWSSVQTERLARFRCSNALSADFAEPGKKLISLQAAALNFGLKATSHDYDS